MLLQLKSLFTNFYSVIFWIGSSLVFLAFGNEQRTLELVGSLMGLMLLDILIGLFTAKKMKVYVSRALTNGVKIKISTLIVVAVAHQLDRTQLFVEVIKIPLIIPITTAFIIAEVKSVIELVKDKKVQEIFQSLISTQETK